MPPSAAVSDAVNPDAFVPRPSPVHWATGPWNIPYHDTEWGVPVHDDRTHFEFLVLEGAQAGLSWLTILKKRDGYHRLFADFDVEKVARFTSKRVEKILLDPGIIRNRAKVEAAVRNARAFIAVQDEFGTFDTYLGVRRGPSQGEQMAARGPAARDDADLGSRQRRPTKAGLPVRRAHGLLLPPPSRRIGQRPPGQLLPLRRAHLKGGRRPDTFSWPAATPGVA